MMTSKFPPLPSPVVSPFASYDRQIPQSKNWSSLPFSTSQTSPSPRPQLQPLPAWPASQVSQPTPPQQSRPPQFSIFPGAPSSQSSVPQNPPPPRSPQPSAATEPDFTDDDLREAFGPIVEHAVRKAVYARENGIDTHLEPMLRATIRRALAEYAPSSRPFQAPRSFDRLCWHLQALFTSRTYEDILFEKTHRFQVEEVFLVDAASLALVSFASCDPARHASAKRITSTVQRIALQLRDEEGKIRPSFELGEQRHIISCEGKFVTLVAIVRGRPNDLLLTDLDFALRRIEDHFREHFQKDGSPLLHPLQPYLEDCLLIQAPASAA